MKMRRRGSFHCVRATFMLHIYLIRCLIAWNDQKRLVRCMALKFEVELMVHGIGLSNGISWSCRNVDILLRRAKILALHIWYYRNCPGQGWGGHRASAFRIVRGVVSVGSGLGALDTGHLLSAASTIGPALCSLPSSRHSNRNTLLYHWQWSGCLVTYLHI